MDLSSLGWILRFNVAMIFDTLSGFLIHTVRMAGICRQNRALIRIHYDGIVYRPDVLQDELHEQGLQVPPFELFIVDDSLGLGIQVKVPPQYALEVGLPNSEFARI